MARIATVVLAALLCACGPRGLESSVDSSAQTPSSAVSTTATSGTLSRRASASPVCSGPDGAIEWRTDAITQLTLIHEGDGLEVYAGEYPLPGETQGLWSQWGQGIVADDGRYISAVGDHLGVDGNSYFFAYDPETRELVRFMDVLSLVDHQPGAGGYGKVHAQMVEGTCGQIWSYTYWGTRNDLEYGNGYSGDVLIELDPTSETIASHGVVATERGVPTMASSPDGRYLALDAVDPFTDEGKLVIYDTDQGVVVDEVDDPAPRGHRSIGVSADGNFWFSIGGGRLAAYDPERGVVTEMETELPSKGSDDFLRAVTAASPDATVYGVMQDERTIFAYGADGALETLAPAEGYTASIAMTESGDRLFWLPNAHGSAWEVGAVVKTMDTASGEVSDLVALLDPFQEHLDLFPGGTYSMSYANGRLFIGVNSAENEEDSGFGTVVLVVIEGLAS